MILFGPTSQPGLPQTQVLTDKTFLCRNVEIDVTREATSALTADLTVKKLDTIAQQHIIWQSDRLAHTIAWAADQDPLSVTCLGA